MKTLIQALLATLITAAGLAAAPALGEPARKTELVDLDGKSVDSMKLSYDFDAVWVVDDQETSSLSRHVSRLLLGDAETGVQTARRRAKFQLLPILVMATACERQL